MNTPRLSKRPATVAELQLATELFAKRAHTDVSLAPFTTYRVGGNAALHVHAESIDDLEAISTVLAQVDLPLLVIGRGSNILIADTGFQGLAITFGGFLEYIDLPDRSDDGGSQDGDGSQEGSPAVEPIALFGHTGNLSLKFFELVSGYRCSVESDKGLKRSKPRMNRNELGSHARSDKLVDPHKFPYQIIHAEF